MRKLIALFFVCFAVIAGLTYALPVRADIQDVIDNKAFYSVACVAQATGNQTSIMIWNPPTSPTYMSLVKSSWWSSVGTEFNLKRTTTTNGFGTNHGKRNSKLFPGSGGSVASSNFELVRLSSGTAPAANSLEVYNGDQFSADYDEYPFTMGPGEGLVMIPDTLGATNWCWSVTVVETPITP